MKTYVAGHTGMVGSAIIRRLQSEGHSRVFGVSHAELDLCNQAAVDRLFRREKPDYVYLSAATVGGIDANTRRPVEFLYNNLMIACNVIEAAARHGVKKLLYLGSSCIYPKLAPQPIPESALLAGALEPTNEAYALAKIAGLKLCSYYRREYGKSFISAMPTNLYGPGDNYHPTASHVIPGMLRRFHEAKISDASTVTLWGSGKPLREFLHVDDLASALTLIMRDYDHDEPINCGSGEEVSIAALGDILRRVTGFQGTLAFDASKPDGTPRKLLDSSKLFDLGWRPTISLERGLSAVYTEIAAVGTFDRLRAAG